MWIPKGSIETRRSTWWADFANPLWLPLALAGVGALLWIAFLRGTGIILDDALITYRYAQNIALGFGFVFNEGERVLGTTTPLLTLVLALCGRLVGVEHIPLCSNVLMITAGLVAGLFLYGVLRRAGVGLVCTSAGVLLFYAHPNVVWTSTGGMETPLALMLMMASLYALCVRAWTWAMAAAALLVLTRIDGAIWAGFVALYVTLIARRASLTPWLMFGGLVGTWIAFAVLYFGSPIPLSAVAKQALVSKFFSTEGAIGELRGLNFRFREAVGLVGAEGMFRRVLLIMIILVLLGVLRVLRRGNLDQPLYLLPAFVVAFCVAFQLGRAPHFPWYAVPLTGMLMLLVALGLSELWLLFSLYWREFGWPRRRLHMLAAGLLMCCGVALADGNHTTFQYHRAFQINEDTARRGLGLWLKENTAADAVVAMEAVGYQAYYSDRRVIDLAGLVSPEVVEILKRSESNADAFHQIITELKPDYIVLRAFEVAENRHFHGGPMFVDGQQEAAFVGNYFAVKRFAKPNLEVVGDNSELIIYKRITEQGGD